jgi:hypothetical protein
VAAVCVYVFQRRRRALAVGAAVLGIFTVAFAFTARSPPIARPGETSTLFYENLPEAARLDLRVHRGARTVLVGTAIADPNGIWLTQFFNPNACVLREHGRERSAAGAERHDRHRRLQRALRLSNTRTAPFAVADNKVHLAGKVVRRTKYLTLYKIDRPLRARRRELRRQRRRLDGR